MKKLLLLFALLLSFSYAQAIEPGFVKYTESTSGASFYYHPKSIKKRGGLVYVWTMNNVGGYTNGGFYFESKCQTVINCKTYENDTTYIHHLDAKGNVISSVNYRTREWTPIPPGSVMEMLAKIVCKK